MTTFTQTFNYNTIKSALIVTVCVTTIVGLIGGLLVEIFYKPPNPRDHVTFWIGNRGVLFAILQFILWICGILLIVGAVYLLPNFLTTTKQTLARLVRKVDLTTGKLDRVLTNAEQLVDQLTK